MANSKDPTRGVPHRDGWITMYVLKGEDEAPAEVEIHPGDWKVTALKAALGIAEELLLVQVGDTGVTKYKDDDHVHVFDGEQFAGQTRGGGAS